MPQTVKAAIAWMCGCGFTNLPWSPVCTACGGNR
jgi:hypothetical protein